MKKTHTYKKLAIGAFGLFNESSIKLGGEWLVGIWLALEDLYHEKDWWIGCYSAYDVIRWGQTNRVITPGEYDRLFNLLQN